jgi:hypothetical protein
MANPLTFEPGSIFRVTGRGSSVTSFFRITVKGYSLKTLALPTFNNLRANDGLHGASGLRLVSKTKT